MIGIVRTRSVRDDRGVRGYVRISLERITAKPRTESPKKAMVEPESGVATGLAGKTGCVVTWPGPPLTGVKPPELGGKLKLAGVVKILLPLSDNWGWRLGLLF